MKHSLSIAVLIALAGFCLSFAALAATEDAPSWGEVIPPEITASALTPDLVLDEKPSDWRPVLEPIFRPVVANCRSAREATLAIASRMGELTGVCYDRGRRHPCMNPLESLAEKKVSCTGQSILLVCALRSVGIPARAVGVWTWGHVPGNHTWVEAWFEGQWHMVEFNESQFNTPWVMEAIGMLAPEAPGQRILAAQAGGAHLFPAVWNLHAGISAEDVTERYQTLARQWYADNGVPEDCQKLMVNMFPRFEVPRTLLLENAEGQELARAALPTSTDDVRRFASLLLPRTGECFLRVEGSPDRLSVHATASAVQLLLLRPATRHGSEEPSGETSR